MKNIGTVRERKSSNLNNVGVELVPKIHHITSNTAITLIALIITIIVLLILAGITLSMVMGESRNICKSK